MGEPRWTVVIPTKRSEVAKSRLGPALGRWRPDLARAFTRDTVDAARSCARVSRLVVVHDDPEPDPYLDRPGTRLLPDPTHGRDLNAAISAGVRAALDRAHGPVAVLVADLPALRSGELSDALQRASRLGSVVVGDAQGSGTTMLAATQPEVLLVPRFGTGSFARHVAAGAEPLESGPGLARDIDTPDDLGQAVTLGVGHYTATVLTEAGLT